VIVRAGRARNRSRVAPRRSARPQRDRRVAEPRLAALAAGVLVLLALLAPHRATASDYDEQRARTAVRLFRSLLAADLAIDQKARPDGSILVVFFGTEGARTRELAELLSGDAEGGSGVHGHAIAVEVANDPKLARYLDAPPAGVFLVADPGAQGLQQIIDYGIAHRVIVYSPFEGHVEKGVLAGLSIEAQVRPYLNAATLQASAISLKSFFLKVTKLYP
jgi:hypothetical protein